MTRTPFAVCFRAHAAVAFVGQGLLGPAQLPLGCHPVPAVRGPAGERCRDAEEANNQGPDRPAAAREGEKFTTALRRQSSASAVRAGEGDARLQVEFSGEIFQWRGPAPYYFVAVPEEQSRQLRVATSGTSYHRGMIRVQARIGDAEWATSMWHKDERYLLPIGTRCASP